MNRNDDLITFSRVGNYKLVKLLLDNDASVHAWDNYALRVAAYYGHLDVVKLLLDNGANANAENSHTLRWAARNGHLDVAELLNKHIKENRNEI